MGEGFDRGELMVTLAYLGWLTIIGVVRAAFYPRATQVTAWMEGHGLDPDAPSRRAVTQYLRRTRWIRTIGFLIGASVPLLIALARRDERVLEESFQYWWVVGFGVGVVLAELVRPLARGSATVVEPRLLDQYLPAFTRIDRWLLAGLPVVLLIASLVVPEGESIPEPRRGLWWYLGLSLTAIAMVVVVRGLQEMILRRRQRADDLDAVHADDAMRSASIHAVAGLGYGGPMWVSAVMALDLGVSGGGAERLVFFPLGVFLAFAGFGMLLGFPRLETKWTVPRARQA